jgi:hypothetical protein
MLVKQAARDCADPTVFYELGRNFFFCYDQTESKSNYKLSGGFAHVNRFYSIDGAGPVGGRWMVGTPEEQDYDEYRYDMLIDLLKRYLADPKLNWQNTIGAGKMPPNPYKWGFQTNCVMAAFFNLIRRDHGMEGYRQFWRMLAGAAPAKDLRQRWNVTCRSRVRWSARITANSVRQGVTCRCRPTPTRLRPKSNRWAAASRLR